jgi:hypothetical protein
MNVTKKTYTKATADEDFIDSVHEVKLDIRSHRNDTDFEKMLAELNKKSAEKKEYELQEKISKTDNTDITDVADKAETPVPNVAENRQEESLEENVSPESTEDNDTDADSEEKESVPTESVQPTAVMTSLQFPINEHLDKADSHADESKSAAKKQLSADDFKGIWDNPDLSGGGRISMNIKTGYRREIKITVPQTIPTPEQIWEYQPTESDFSAVPDTDTENVANTADSTQSRGSDISSDSHDYDYNDGYGYEEESAETKLEKAARADVYRRRFSTASAVICLAIFFCTGFYLLVCPRDGDFAKMPVPSTETVIDGSYFEQLDEWYCETIPNADKIKELTDKLMNLLKIS